MQAGNLEETKFTLRKGILSDLTEFLAEIQKKMLKLIAPVAKKQTALTVAKESDSEPENVSPTTPSIPARHRTTTVNLKTTPVNDRNCKTVQWFRR